MADAVAQPWTLVTGATSDIGRCIVRRVSAQAPVLLAGRDADGLARVQGESVAGHRLDLWQSDLSDPIATGESLTQWLADHPEGIDRFLHVAGGGLTTPLRLQSAADVSEQLMVNLGSALEIARVLCRKKVNRAGLAQVLFLSSVNAARGVKGRAPYAAAKAGLEAAVRCLALEWAPRTRVNAIAPGGVKTAPVLAAHPDEESLSAADAHHPLGLGEPEDVADLVEFLLSDRARWITGQTITLDGGLSLRV